MEALVVTLLILPFIGALVCGILPRGGKSLAVLVSAAAAVLAVLAVWNAYPQGWQVSFGRLPWLPGSGEGRGTTLTLSEHFGKRPVALIFGSYT